MSVIEEGNNSRRLKEVSEEKALPNPMQLIINLKITKVLRLRTALLEK